uniref:POTRA domain-containing protein n=1 Tax=Rhodochaete parvula TaxID=110510 RepID=A0A220T0D9_9RHOD|nr:hypothetical protein Rhodc_020 [Rhodochaete parvula]
MILRGIENAKFEYKTRSFLNLKNLETLKEEITEEEIKKLLDKIKLSGFFTAVKIKSEIINKIQIITINCTVGPIIKKINFLHNSQLLIPELILEKIFKEQIGNPINFHLLNNAVNHIHKWYYDRGFHWVEVKINKHNTQTESINVSIQEGKINSIQFKFPNYTTINRQENEEHIIKLIRKFLKIEEEKILNYYNIEQGLNQLKDKKFVDNCDYNIQLCKAKQKVDVIIYLYKIADKTTHISGKNIHLASEIAEIIETETLKVLNHLFYNNKKRDNSKLYNTSIIKYQPQLNDYPTTVHKNINCESIIIKILTKLKYYQITDLYEWYTYSLNLITQNNIKFCYRLHNLGIKHEYITIKFQLPDLNNFLEIRYCKPWINISNKQSGLMTIKILKKFIYIQQKNISDALTQVFNNNWVICNSLLNINTIKLRSKFQLSNNIDLKQCLSINRNLNRHLYLQNTNEIINLYIQNMCNYKYENNTVFGYSIPQVTKKSKLKFLAFDTKLTYKNNNTDNIDWFGKGIYFMFISKYIVPLSNLNKNTIQNYKHQFIQRNIFKSILYYNFSFKQNFIPEQFVILDIEAGQLLGSPAFFPSSENFELQSPISMRGYADTTSIFPKLFYKLSLEMHIVIDNIQSAFLFIDYMYNQPRKLINTTFDISQILFTNNILNNKQHNIAVGIGYQFKAPIKKLPPIRLECSFTHQQEMQIYLKVGPRLSSIAIKKY